MKMARINQLLGPDASTRLKVMSWDPTVYEIPMLAGGGYFLRGESLGETPVYLDLNQCYEWAQDHLERMAL